MTPQDLRAIAQRARETLARRATWAPFLAAQTEFWNMGASKPEVLQAKLDAVYALRPHHDVEDPSDSEVDLATALLAAMDENERLRNALEGARRKHTDCEDSWYSCPKSPDGCSNDGVGHECNCGADRVNAMIDAALHREPEESK